MQPLNFSLLSQAQQKAVIAAFRAFLDSLDFPVQIVMRTVNLELGGYLQSLDARLASAGPEMAEEVQSFKSFVRELIEKKSVKNRLFYVVIPFSPANSSNALADALVNLERFVFGASSRKTSFEVNNELALNQLGVRLKLCGEKLTRCGLVCGRLDSAQLVALLASYFEDFVVAGSDYLFPVTMLEGFEAGREARA